MALTRDQIGPLVRQVVHDTPVLDIHTHLFAPEFGELALWGIDELLTYHYLICEALVNAVLYLDTGDEALAREARLRYDDAAVHRPSKRIDEPATDGD